MSGDDELEIERLGSLAEQIESFQYSPDDLTLERWDKLLRCPHIGATTEEQISRIVRIRAATITAAAVMLRLCPNSSSLDRAIHFLHDAQIQAITAIQANE